jgi:hypothetical protein
MEKGRKDGRRREAVEGRKVREGEGRKEGRKEGR